MVNKRMRFLCLVIACLTLFASTSAFAFFQSWNDSSASDANNDLFSGSQSFDFGFNQQGNLSFSNSFSASTDRKTSIFRRHFSADEILSYYKKITADDVSSKGTKNIINDYKSYLTLEAMVKQAVISAADATAAELSASAFTVTEPSETSNSFTSPGWKYFAAILPIIETEEQFESILLVESAADGALSISCEKMRQAAMKIAGKDGQVYLKASLVYAYLLTVYNERGKAVSFRQPKLPSSMTTELVYPLESTTRIRKSWFAKRDGGARKHTGTDIHANEDTEIYSCTDGTVTYIGFAATPGYYVIVEDKLGYEYHYYHMVRMTDFLKQGDTVKAGDLLGHVGNTGNSDVNHLHITIVAPNGQYIDPYSLMVSAYKRTK